MGPRLLTAADALRIQGDLARQLDDRPQQRNWRADPLANPADSLVPQPCGGAEKARQDIRKVEAYATDDVSAMVQHVRSRLVHLRATLADLDPTDGKFWAESVDAIHEARGEEDAVHDGCMAGLFEMGVVEDEGGLSDRETVLFEAAAAANWEQRAMIARHATSSEAVTDYLAERPHDHAAAGPKRACLSCQCCCTTACAACGCCPACCRCPGRAVPLSHAPFRQPAPSDTPSVNRHACQHMPTHAHALV